MTPIEQVVAEAAIRQVQMRYCRGVDRMEFDLLRSCFLADAELVYSFFAGDVDAFVVMARQSLTGFDLTTHLTGNHLISIEGAIADAEFFTLATHRMAADDKGPERDYVASIRYFDRMERRGDDWRIVRRRCGLDWARSDPVPDHCDGAKTGEARRDPSDPSYGA